MPIIKNYKIIKAENCVTISMVFVRLKDMLEEAMVCFEYK